MGKVNQTEMKYLKHMYYKKHLFLKYIKSTSK